jgi:para-nitrobenzyl esterase
MSDHPQVTTTSGRFVGRRGDACDVFRGIPYAADPVGEGRFAPPRPLTRTSDVADATSYGPKCPQADSALEAVLGGGHQVMSEEGCLNLNVWTPRVGTGDRPVMVWIHGGGFQWGSSASPWYDGTAFARDQDVVVVSLNYRLGVLGFGFLGDLDGGSPLSGSLGIQDIELALRWVRDNVAAFGGDAANVTVFGESAGAMAIGTLLGVPSARGLFRRAILQSGAASSVATIDSARATTEEFTEILGEGRSVSQWRSLPVAALLDAAEKLAAVRPQELRFVPVVDGEYLPVHPLTAVASGAAVDVEVLLGTNKDEWRLFSLADPYFPMTTEEDLVRVVTERLGDRATDAITAYRRHDPQRSAPDVRVAIVGDAVFRIPAIRLAEAHGAAGGRAHMYLFTYASRQAGGLLGSCHGLEIPFVFHTLHQPGAELLTGEDAPTNLAATMNAAWAAFATSGDPSKNGLPSWPLYDTSRRATMTFDQSVAVVDDPMSDEREALKTLS